MTNYAIPIAKMLTPGGAQPWQYVSPLGYEWWEAMTPLEEAHREGRLFCPHCGGRLLYCCGEKVPPYFRHPDKSCLVGEGIGATPSGRRTRAPAIALRYQFARLLLHMLPAGAKIDEERAFLQEQGDLMVTLPDGRQVLFELETSPDGYATLPQRRAQHAEMGIPVYQVFTGDLLYGQIATARNIVDTRLDPLVVQAMKAAKEGRRRSWVDQAYSTLMRYPFIRTGTPMSALFYQPGKTKEEFGTLIGLRGLRPDPGRTNRWVGAVIRAEISKGKAHTVRFTSHRGFDFHEDLVALRLYRAEMQKQRQQAAERRRQEELTRTAAEERARQVQAPPPPPPPSTARPSGPPIKTPGGGTLWLAGRLNTIPVVDGMVSPCPLKSKGPVRLDDCKYCDYRHGGDAVTQIVCGWPRRIS